MIDSSERRGFVSEFTRDCFSSMKQMTLIEKTQFLNHLIQDKLAGNFEDIGFCYWHISDAFALLRDGASLYLNHCAFDKFIKGGDSYYLYWVVSDATQRLTLEVDGYSDYWWRLYSNAIQENAHGQYDFAEFCAHRAALYVNPRLPHITITCHLQ